jgi:hypothetical protein
MAKGKRKAESSASDGGQYFLCYFNAAVYPAQYVGIQPYDSIFAEV